MAYDYNVPAARTLPPISVPVPSAAPPVPVAPRPVLRNLEAPVLPAPVPHALIAQVGRQAGPIVPVLPERQSVPASRQNTPSVPPAALLAGASVAGGATPLVAPSLDMIGVARSLDGMEAPSDPFAAGVLGFIKGAAGKQARAEEKGKRDAIAEQLAGYPDLQRWVINKLMDPADAVKIKTQRDADAKTKADATTRKGKIIAYLRQSGDTDLADDYENNILDDDGLQKAMIERTKAPGEQWGPLSADDATTFGIDDPTGYVINSKTREIKQVPGAGGGDDADQIAQAIIRGEQPPDTTGLYKLGAPVRAQLAKAGYDMTQAKLDYDATKRNLASLNGPQQLRLRQAVGIVDDSLGKVEDLAQQWQGSNFPALNKAALASAKQGLLGPNAQSIATQLEAEIADVTSELGTVYKGGNGSTDESLKLAATQLSAAWSESQLLDAIKLARTNLTYRKNSLNLATAGIANSQYSPVTSAPDDTNTKTVDGVTYVRDENGDWYAQ